MFVIKWRYKGKWIPWTMGIVHYSTINAALSQIGLYKQFFPKNEYRVESEQDMYESDWNRSMAI